MPFGVLSGVPDIITHAKFCVNRLRGLSAATPRKVPFPILFRTTLTTSITVPNLKFLASTDPDILAGTQNSESGLRDPHVTTYDLILDFFFVRTP